MIQEGIGPFNLEVEKRILGVLISEPIAVDYAQTVLTADCFFEQKHCQIFEAVVNLSKKSIPVDIISLSDELKKMGVFEEIGGLPYIYEIGSYVPPARFEHYCKIIARDAKQRKLIQLLKKNLKELEIVPAENIDELESRLAIIEKELREGLPEQIKILDYNDLVKHKLEIGTEKRGLLPGQPDLDKHIDLRPGQILTIYGDTGHKKTTLALNFAVNWSRKVKVIFYSTEQKPEALAKIAHEIEGEKPTIEDGNLLFAENTPTIEALIAQVRMLKARNGLDVVFIDYLQDLSTDNLKHYREETPRISYFIQLLKDLVLKENLALVIISQMRKREGEQLSINPSLDRMRGSGDIKMASSIILSIVNPKKYGIKEYDNLPTENMMLVRIKKNRDCLTGDPGEERVIKVHNEPASRRIEGLSRRENSKPEYYWQRD